jgi:hypothetical protein
MNPSSLRLYSDENYQYINLSMIQKEACIIIYQMFSQKKQKTFFSSKNNICDLSALNTSPALKNN